MLSFCCSGGGANASADGRLVICNSSGSMAAFDLDIISTIVADLYLNPSGGLIEWIGRGRRVDLDFGRLSVGIERGGNDDVDNQWCMTSAAADNLIHFYSFILIILHNKPSSGLYILSGIDTKLGQQ